MIPEKNTLGVWKRRLAGKKIAVLMGGISAEREISLRSGQAVAESPSLATHGKSSWTIRMVCFTSRMGIIIASQRGSKTGHR